MIVNWTDGKGRTHTGDDQGKEYLRHLAARDGMPGLAKGGIIASGPAADAPSAATVPVADPAAAKRTSK